MKRTLLVLLIVGLVSTSANALQYTFDADVEGFQNVSWQQASPAGWAGIPTVKQTHTAGGWQQAMTKEFSWEAGGGAPNQQLAMQAIANSGSGMLSFDAMVDGTSFPAGASTWFQLIVSGNSDAVNGGWTQPGNLVDSWHDAADLSLRTWHFDLTFAQLGWGPGDQWFQLYTMSNSDGASPVNFYLDNFVVTPEPATMTMLGLGALALLRKR